MYWQRYLFVFLIAGIVQGATEEAARKVLASKCWACHSQSAFGGLRLDSREAMLKGGKSGAALMTGNAAQSRLFQAASHSNPAVKPMPPGGAKLSADELQILEAWINEGAPWTDTAMHWSFVPLRKNQPNETIDGFINRALQKQSLVANSRADRRTLIRRLYFDLTGLPPTETQFAEAIQDNDSEWFSHLATKLLLSPHFGEQWGRHWLDTARYGEDDFSGTKVIPYANAWRYRDWVVQALNQDMPYDRFLKAQLAGDLMNDPSLLPATGLLGLGPWYYGIAQPPQSRADERHDRVDMVTRGMLGVTVACARCHDHKYDPFTAKDYYALAGVFASTGYKEYPLVPDAEVAAWKKQKDEVDSAEKALDKFIEEESERIAERYSTSIASYMMSTVKPGKGLNEKVLARWKTYLAKPDEFHPFLATWFQGSKNATQATSFQKLLLDIRAEKKTIDEENRKLVEEAKKTEPKIKRTIILPGGYRSEEDFNPGAYIASKSLDRDRFVVFNRIFGEASAPLKFDRDVTVELMDTHRRPEYERLKAKFDQLKKALPVQYAYVQGATEFDPMDLNLNIRGNPESLGDVVPRRFPLVLSSGKTIPFNEGSGRIQLAETVAHHPLAARVAVNRIWLTLFGQGLVRTPSNFGRVGDRPTLPDLLEFLSARFVERGFSTKALIREIVLSDAYQRSSLSNPVNDKTDPEDRYLWRQSRRRLEAEPILDSMLAVSGELDEAVGGESKPLTADFHRRTLYAKTSRFQQDETMSLFDLPAASVTCEQRAVTNVPLQKLFFLNSDTVARRSDAVAKQIRNDDVDRGVDAAYGLLLQRKASENERRLGREFLKQAGADGWKEYAKVLLSSNEFTYVD